MRFREWLLTEKHDVSYSFSSTQVDFPDSVASKVIQWSKDNIPDEVLVDDGKAHGREDEIHVTALYGLHSEDPDKIEPVVNRTKKFDLTLGKVSKFEGEKYDVIKIDVSSNPLHGLNKSLRKLPHSSSFKTYVPHCTVAYVQKGSCDKLLGNTDFSGTKVPAKAITFSSKNGQKTKIQLK